MTKEALILAPDQASRAFSSICRKISEQTAARFGAMEPERVVERLNRMLSSWSNYFRLGQVFPAYAAIDAHTKITASPVAVSQRQGEKREIRALF